MPAPGFIAACVLALALSGNTAQAQQRSPRLFTAGAAIAISCPGAYDDIPVPEADCSERLDGAPGPYARPYLTVRPTDRLMVTTTVGTLRMPALQREVYNDGRRHLSYSWQRVGRRGTYTPPGRTWGAHRSIRFGRSSEPASCTSATPYGSRSPGACRSGSVRSAPAGTPASLPCSRRAS
jgi:hypothetical protein